MFKQFIAATALVGMATISYAQTSVRDTLMPDVVGIGVSADKEFIKDEKIFLQYKGALYVLHVPKSSLLGMVTGEKTSCEKFEVKHDIGFYQNHRIEFANSYALYDDEQVAYRGNVVTNLYHYRDICPFPAMF